MSDSAANILRQAKTVAVVGLSDDPSRPSNEVAAYLQEQGYEIIPVNPRVSEVLGAVCYSDLQAIPTPVDVVDVFRRSEHVVPIARAAVEIGAKALWLQDGVVNEEAAEIAREAGLAVVMDDCMLRRHAMLKRQGVL